MCARDLRGRACADVESVVQHGEAVRNFKNVVKTVSPCRSRSLPIGRMGVSRTLLGELSGHRSAFRMRRLSFLSQRLSRTAPPSQSSPGFKTFDATGERLKAVGVFSFIQKVLYRSFWGVADVRNPWLRLLRPSFNRIRLREQRPAKDVAAISLEGW